MTRIALPLLAGVPLALGLVGYARHRPSRGDRPYAIGLFVAAAVYVAFAATGGAHGRWLVIEIAGVALFGAAAYAGLRRRPLILAVGWAAHVVWDLALHGSGPGAGYTPEWYPWLCVSFDAVIAAAIAGAVLRREVRAA